VLGAAGIDGAVVEAGTTVEAAPGDLLVERGTGGLAVRAAEGTIRIQEPTAHLRGARDARALVQQLLDRCAAAEARA
jgi:hypothetical protein